MVIDTLAHQARYVSLHPRFREAFDFLARTDLDALPNGRTTLDGDRLFALVQNYETQPIHAGKLEAHQKYIDIQYVVSGEEFVGYAPLGGQTVATPHDPAKDIAFYDGEAWFTLLRKGMFAIFFPQDAHLPGRHTDTPRTVRKIVLKIALTQ